MYGCGRWSLLALLVCACVLLYLDMCLAAAAPRETRVKMSSSGAGTYCGSRLADALRFMCNGQYNAYFKKKSSSSGQYRTRRDLEENVAPPVQLPFRERLRAAAFLESRPRATRVTRGVFDECCLKSCTLDELMNYCGAPGDS